MSSLVIDAVRCREETDEIGSDDVYVVVFRGDPKAPFGSNVGVHGPGSVWSDFDTTEFEGTGRSNREILPGCRLCRHARGGGQRPRHFWRGSDLSVEEPIGTRLARRDAQPRLW